eukprot:1161816-Pelagomonas_calceolata.AAC.7
MHFPETLFLIQVGQWSQAILQTFITGCKHALHVDQCLPWTHIDWMPKVPGCRTSVFLRQHGNVNKLNRHGRPPCGVQWC